MTPDMNNDPRVLLVLAAVAWAILALQSWRARRAERQVKNDHPTTMRSRRDEEWRNRWH